MTAEKPKWPIGSVTSMMGREFSPETCRWAVEVTLEELAGRDDLRPVDAGRVAAVRNLATAVDFDCTNAALWRQFREALEELTNGSDDGGSLDDALADLMPAEVGDASPAGAADSGS